MTNDHMQDIEAVNQFMLAEFKAAVSRRAMHTQSIETLLNIHLTVVSIAAAGLVALWTQQSSGAPLVPITSISLLLLLVLGLIIENRISVHDANNRWDGYRYRLAEQFFLDKYPASEIADYTEWPDKPQKRLTISRGSFGRSFIGITAMINSLVLMGVVLFGAVLLSFEPWFVGMLSVIVAIVGWYIQRWNFHRGAKRQGFILQLSSDPSIIRKSRYASKVDTKEGI